MLSGWLVNGWEDAGMGFPGLHPRPGLLLTVCAHRQVSSFSETQVPLMSKDVFEGPSWCQALAPSRDHLGRPFGRGMLGVAEIEGYTLHSHHRRVLLLGREHWRDLRKRKGWAAVGTQSTKAGCGAHGGNGSVPHCVLPGSSFSLILAQVALLLHSSVTLGKWICYITSRLSDL